MADLPRFTLITGGEGNVPRHGQGAPHTLLANVGPGERVRGCYRIARAVPPGARPNRLVLVDRSAECAVQLGPGVRLPCEGLALLSKVLVELRTPNDPTRSPVLHQCDSILHIEPISAVDCLPVTAGADPSDLHELALTLAAFENGLVKAFALRVLAVDELAIPWLRPGCRHTGQLPGSASPLQRSLWLARVLAERVAGGAHMQALASLAGLLQPMWSMRGQASGPADRASADQPGATARRERMQAEIAWLAARWPQGANTLESAWVAAEGSGVDPVRAAMLIEASLRGGPPTV